MRRYTLLLIVCVAVVAAGIFAVLITPLAVSIAVKLWIVRAARQQGLTITVGSVDAPLLRPVVVHGVRITAVSGDAVKLEIERAELDLRLPAWFGASPKRLLRDLKLHDVRGEIQNPRSDGNRTTAADWKSFQHLLADQFTITSVQLTVRIGDVRITLRDAMLSANDTESGTFRAAEIAVATPWFAKPFTDLRGATSWQENRLTVAAVSLMHGLDLDVLTFDFGQLDKQRIGFDAAFDTFGGKLRASTSVENDRDQRNWDIAGNATEVSLARMSDALDFSTRASGSIHACKFTFRGSARDFANATASIWLEVTGLTWRDRTAETLMFGASLYSRQIQVEQLYLKQRRNELTLSGELALGRAAGELPEFHGDISAAIGDLGELARLLGGSAADFAGEVAINGNVTEREHKFVGQLVASGNSLKLFGAPIETLDARLILNGAELQLQKCELRRIDEALPSIIFRGAANFSDTNAVTADLSFDQPFVILGAPPPCIAEIRLATAPDGQDSTANSFTRLGFRGPLLRVGWTLRLANERSDPNVSAPAADLSLPFCARREDNTGALSIAPAKPK
jgi:hypothetical protein